MLNVQRLDDLDYNKIFERARGRIPTLTDEWTDFNDHDPGITTLQTFAWLYDSLNYYMGATGEVHRLNYLKLLGIEPKQSAASCCLAFDVQNDVRLPRGTRVAAGDVVFELEEHYHADTNHMVRLYNEIEGRVLDLSGFAGVDGEYASIFTLDRTQSACVYLGFARSFADKARFYVEVEEGVRNAFSDSFSLAVTQWEFYDGSGWKRAHCITDETCGFLRSGFITLALEGETAFLENAALDGAHYLRCRLLENDYDMCPHIGRIVVNCTIAVQTKTWAQMLSYQYNGADRILLDWYIRDSDLLTVLVEQEDGFARWYHYAQSQWDSCCIEKCENQGERWLCFDEQTYGKRPMAGAKIYVFIVAKEAADTVILGKTDGYALQRLQFDGENIYQMELMLLSPTQAGTMQCSFWKPCEDLSHAGYEDAVFAYDRATGEVVFGDSIHGLQPKSGQLVVVCMVKTSMLDAGNILQGQVTQLLDATAVPISVSNLKDAQGGERLRTSVELEVEIEHKLRAVTRAVTSEDYCTIVKNTPGLLIDAVTVIPMKDYCQAYGMPYKSNTVVVAVKPTFNQACPILSETYRRWIRQNLEQYRLLTTDIQVISARYVGIGVYGFIHLDENNPRTQQQVKDCLSAQIDSASAGRFGANIDYGRLFSTVETMPCVKQISQLSLEYIGSGGRKNEHGDIVVFPDSLTYVQEIRIEFV